MGVGTFTKTNLFEYIGSTFQGGEEKGVGNFNQKCGRTRFLDGGGRGKVQGCRVEIA